MNAADMAAAAPLRALVVGFPGAGKTGSLACLANAGLKLRVLAFDKIGSMQPLLQYTDPDKLKNIDIMLFEDPLRATPAFVEVAGKPMAYYNAHKALDEWKYTNLDGTETNLGRSKDWGPDIVLVLDNLTSMGDASKRRVMSNQNRTPANFRDTDYGFAMGEQEAFVERICSSRNRFHVIVLSHKRMIGPKDERKGESEIAAQIKKEEADLITSRYYPSALGRQLPMNIARHFPTTLECEKIERNRKQVRVIKSIGGPEIDLKLPTRVQGLDNLDISDGMLKIFNATTPGVEACLKAAAGDQPLEENTQ